MSNKSKTMSFQWNYGKGALVQRLGFGSKLNKYFAETLLAYGEPYTPLKEGTLRSSATITANQNNARIQYPGVSYADYQYYADDSNWNRHTNGTTSMWLDYAWSVHQSQITGKVGAYRRWQSKK